MGSVTGSEISIIKFLNEIFAKCSKKGILENNDNYQLSLGSDYIKIKLIYWKKFYFKK